MTPSEQLRLERVPAGFKFAPSDYVLVNYLHDIVYHRISINDPVIASGNIFCFVDVYKTEPWKIPVRFKYALGTEAYYITPRRPQHHKGRRVARRAGAGTWKASGTAKPVEDDRGHVVGYVMPLCYVKEDESGSSGWVMDEYTLTAGREGDEFERLAICRIKRNAVTEKRMRQEEKITKARKERRRADCEEESGQLVQCTTDLMALARVGTAKQETEQIHDSKYYPDSS